jgi:hypothetical protein
MNSKKLNDWLQIVGLFGVIGSLIFVGLQLKQTQDIALSDTYQNRAAIANDVNAASLSSPEFLSGVSKVYLNRIDELTMPEAIALEFYVGSILLLIENNHLQLEAGYLNEEHWQSNLNEMRCMFSIPLFRQVAHGWDFRESFREIISEVMREIPDDAPNCWADFGWDFPLQ